MEAKSVIKMYEDSFRRHWDNIALSDFRGERITYAELAKRIARVHILLENAGVKPGDKVALCGKNCLAWGISFFGVYTYGAIPVPILNDFKPGNVHMLVNHSESKYPGYDPDERYVTAVQPFRGADQGNGDS